MPTRMPLVGLYLLLVGLFIVGYWVLWIITGNLEAGVETTENGNLVLFRITADLLTGLLAAAGGLGLLFGQAWGVGTGYVGLGMLLYTSIATMAQAAAENPPLMALLGLAIVLTLLSLGALARRGRQATRSWGWR